MEEQEESEEEAEEEDRMAGWRLLNCGNIKTGTVKKKQNWLSSIEYGGNGAHTNHLPLSV